MEIPDYERLLNLNTMRNNAQHNNMVAMKEDIDFQVSKSFRTSFLKWLVIKIILILHHDDLSFESFISDENIR